MGRAELLEWSPGGTTPRLVFEPGPYSDEGPGLGTGKQREAEHRSPTSSTQESAVSHSTKWMSSYSHSRVLVGIPQGKQSGPAPKFRQKTRVSYHSHGGLVLGGWLELKEEIKPSLSTLSYGPQLDHWALMLPSGYMGQFYSLWDVRQAFVKLWNPGLSCRQVGLQMDGASCLIHLYLGLVLVFRLS